MAAYLTPVPVVRASGDSQRKSWWTPLFGWSAEPDYIDSATNTGQIKSNNISFSAVSESGPDRKTVVKFTDEKARKLRMLTMETESFPDAMYHSTIASRLASDFSDRSDY